MKTLSAKAKISGLTLIELLVVICILAVLAALLLPAHSGGGRSKNIVCMNHLKQIDLSFCMFANDNQGKFPMQIPVASGGTMEFINSDHVFPHFQKTSEYLNQPQLLHCPLDTNRVAVVSYEALNDLAISYFLNADASTNSPAQSILIGDRFLRSNDKLVKSGLFVLATNLNMSWTPELHYGRGNLGFADGHVESSKANLNSIVQSQPLATNRFCVP